MQRRENRKERTESSGRRATGQSGERWYAVTGFVTDVERPDEERLALGICDDLWNLTGLTEHLTDAAFVLINRAVRPSRCRRIRVGPCLACRVMAAVAAMALGAPHRVASTVVAARYVYVQDRSEDQHRSDGQQCRQSPRKHAIAGCSSHRVSPGRQTTQNSSHDFYVESGLHFQLKHSEKAGIHQKYLFDATAGMVSTLNHSRNRDDGAAKFVELS